MCVGRGQSRQQGRVHREAGLTHRLCRAGASTQQGPRAAACARARRSLPIWLETDFRMLVPTFIISALEVVSPGTGPRSGHAQHRAQKTCYQLPARGRAFPCTDCFWECGPAQGRAAAVTMMTH